MKSFEIPSIMLMYIPHEGNLPSKNVKLNQAVKRDNAAKCTWRLEHVRECFDSFSKRYAYTIRIIMALFSKSELKTFRTDLSKPTVKLSIRNVIVTTREAAST